MELTLAISMNAQKRRQDQSGKMNAHLNVLRLKAGISRLEDDHRLVVINKEGNVIDPLIGLEKFARLIVEECANICYDNEYSTPNKCAWKIEQHFEDDRYDR